MAIKSWNFKVALTYQQHTIEYFHVQFFEMEIFERKKQQNNIYKKFPLRLRILSQPP